MSGKELFSTLTSYCSRKEYESQIETTKKAYTMNFKDDYPLHIKNLFSTIGSFPFRSLICQYNQMNFYTCQKIEDETYIVERVKVSQQVSNKSFNDLKISYENMICMEIGVGENNVIHPRQHKVTMTSCSCQFHLSWGLPCRHMIRVHFHTNWLFWDLVPKHVINSQWLVKKNYSISTSCSHGERLSIVSTFDNLEARKKELDHWASLLVECSSKTESDTKSTINMIKNQIQQLTGRTDVQDMIPYKNPDIVSNQHQKRIMPGDISAPTSKAYRKCSKKRRTLEKEKIKNLKTSIINLD